MTDIQRGGYADSFASDELTRGPAIESTSELDAYLAAFRSRYGFSDISGYIEGSRRLRVLAVGEAIIDEYEYCETIGKSGKEPILAARYVSRDRFAGGILAVANQIAVAAGDVTTVTCLGERDSHEDFIRAALQENVRLEAVYLPDAPTIVKRRFVEIYPLQKLFELYIMDGHDDGAAEQERLCATLERVLPQVDAVVVADYGHGMLREKAVEILCARAPFLAINTQMNADNRGFNTVSKYRRADFISVSEHELRLEARSRHRDLRAIVEETAGRLECELLLATRGRRGCVVYSNGGGYFEIPAFTRAIVDRVGAGDAVLALTSLFAAQHAPAEMVGLVGNAVGAAAVGIVGNRSVVELAPFITELEVLLR
jgi:bifunctional ADP-heptose synthase (sugar kinase/adenylyltransferase)